MDFYSASSLKQQSAPLGHIILIPSQPVFAFSPYCCMLSGEATYIIFIVYGVTQSGLEPKIYHISSRVCHRCSSKNEKTKFCILTGIIIVIWRFIFSSPGPKGQVSYCHHLASVSVVRRKLFQKSSPLKLLDQLKPTWSESSLGCLVSKLCPVVPCTNQHGRCY